ncbi:MAG: TonB-dependent receptor [Paludibacteraceae bacterium]
MKQSIMLKKTFIFLFLSIIAGNSYAQNNGKITGKITTSDGYPAEFISIALNGTNHGAVSDKNGNFSFEAPAGNYTLAIFSILCHRKEQTVTVKSGETLQLGNIKIIENKTQLSEVVVTGQFKPQSVRNSVYKVKVINQQQIQSKGATNIQNLLNTELGIRMSNDMALGETDFELMGMSGNNIKVLIDGIPILDRLTKKQSLSQIDINTIERVEIVEGPMSVVYGSDALAGVINIITKKSEHGESKAWKIGARLQEETVGSEYAFGTGDGSHTQSVNAEYKLKNGIYAGANFTHNEFGGWQGALTGRAKRWQPKQQYIPGGRIGYTSDKFNIWYRLDYLMENILTMSDINSLTNTTADKEFIVDRFTHQLQSDWKLSKELSLSGAFSYQDYNRRTRTTNIDLNTGKKTLSLDAGAQDETTFTSSFGRITAVWKPSQKFSLQPGIDYQFTNGIGDRIAIRDGISNTAIFISAEYNPLEWLSIRPGFRTNFNSVFDAPKAVPALNVKTAINNKMDLRLSYGRGYRAPTLQELFYSFHDSNHNIDGNPNLQAEYSNSYMASLVWRSIHNEQVRLTSTISGFFNDFKNRISMLERSEKPGYYMYYNIDIYKTTGATLENSLTWNRMRANLNISYIGRYNSYFNDENYDAQHPSMFRFSPEVSASVSYDWSKIGTFNLFYKHTGARKEYMVNSNNELTLLGLNSFNWADLTYSRKITDYLSVNAGVRNIFDITEVYNSTSGLSSGHGSSSGGSQLGSGRGYFAGLIFNL